MVYGKFNECSSKDNKPVYANNMSFDITNFAKMRHKMKQANFNMQNQFEKTNQFDRKEIMFNSFGIPTGGRSLTETQKEAWKFFCSENGNFYFVSGP